MITLELVSSLVCYALRSITIFIVQLDVMYTFLHSLRFEDLGSCAILLMLGCSFI
jgi:hypothetical protein